MARRSDLTEDMLVQMGWEEFAEDEGRWMCPDCGSAIKKAGRQRHHRVCAERIANRKEEKARIFMSF
jgi:PHP family Zn ribbon phosphoesterase